MESENSVDSILPITDHLTPLVHVQKSRPKREKNVRPSSVYLPVGIRNDTDESLPDFYRSAQGFAEVYRSKSLESVDSHDGKAEISATLPVVAFRKSLVPILPAAITPAELDRSKLRKIGDKPKVMTRTLLSLAIGEKEMKAVGEQKISQLKTSELTEVSLQSARPMDNSLVDNSVKTNEKANSLEEPDENVPSYHHIKGVTGRKYSVGAILPINDQHPPKLPLRVTNSLGAESLLATMTLPSNPDGQGADTAAVEIPKKDRELQTSLHPSTLTKMPSTESRINDNMKSSSEVPIERLPAAQRASEFHKKYTEFQRVMRPLSVSIHSHFAENLEVSNMIFSKPSSLPKETKTTETVAPIRSGAKPFRPDLLQPNQNKMDIQPTIKSPSIVAPTGTPLTPPPTPVDGGKPTFFSHNNDHGADLAKGLEMLKNKTEKSEAINDVTSNGPVSNVQSSSKITQLSAFLERQDRWRFPLDKFKSLPSMATSERHRVIPPNEQIIEASRNVHKEKNDLINDSSVFAVPARVEEVTSDHNSLNRHTGFYTVRLKKVPPTLVDLLRNPHKIKEKESPTSPFSSSSSNQGLETNSLTDGYIQSDTFLQHDTAKVTVQQKEEKERPINYRQTVTRSLVIEPYRKPDISVFGSAQNVSETLSSTLNSAPDGSGSSASVNRQTDVIQSQVAFESYLQPNMIEATDTRQGFPPVTNEDQLQIFGTVRLKPIDRSAAASAATVEEFEAAEEVKFGRKSLIWDKIQLFEPPKIPTKRPKPLSSTSPA